MKKILEVNNICKFYGKKQVLFNVSFSMSEGDILAFIGPNGAGKTTTIKMILGLQKIDSGSILIEGHDIVLEFSKAIKNVGAIVESPDSYMYLSGYQNLKLLSNLYKNIDKYRIDELLKLVGLYERRNDKVSKYSLGMRQRLGIAKALLHNPKVLILDEPTNGLDPEGIRELRALLKKISQNGVAILVSSHNLSELESFCTKVCVIKTGHSSLVEDINSLKKNTNQYVFKVNDTSKISMANVSDISKTEFTFKGSKKDVAQTIQSLVNLGIEIYEVKKVELSLEDVYINKTGGKND